MSEGRERADRLLVARGFFASRAAARAAIEAGLVSINGLAVTKPSQILTETADIRASPAHPYVSRGGLKLAHALTVFGVDPAGRTCLDIGASTGGFTDVLLQQGAAHVTAIDVGRDQFHKDLRKDPRVKVLEGTDARALTRDHISDQTSLLVTDLSFIALEKALGMALDLAATATDFVGLFKPQFQVGRKSVGRRGIVTDLDASERAAQAFELWMHNQGWPIRGWTASPIAGGDGNVERLFHARKL